MVPCNSLYAYLGQQLKAAYPKSGHAFAEWIDFYSGPEFQTSARKLEGLLDTIASPADYGKNQRSSSPKQSL